MEMTLEQKRALALASARLRAQQTQSVSPQEQISKDQITQGAMANKEVSPLDFAMGKISDINEMTMPVRDVVSRGVAFRRIEVPVSVRHSHGVAGNADRHDNS